MKRILQISAVILLTIFFLGLFLWKSNLRQVGHILASTNWGWLVVGILVNFGALVFRTARWRLIISREDPPPWYATFFANTIGYMLSTVLPIRAGDVARPALLARRSNVRFATALGTVLTERVLDLFAILGLFVGFCIVHWRDYASNPATASAFLIVRSAAIIGALIMASLFAFLVGLHFFRQGIRRLHVWLGRWLPVRFREPWLHFFDAFAQTLKITEDPLAFFMVLFWTACIWLCLTAQFWFASMAAHRPMPFDAGLFLGGATTVGIAIPTPGGVGGFHKIAQWVLTTFYGFDIDSSVAVAILFHLVGTLPVVLAGLILFAREGLRWSDVSKETSAEKS